MPSPEPERPAHVLWTGGWDSTFRILELLLTTNREVHPHYIVDSDRKSLNAELQAMEQISSRLRTTLPGASGRLKPHTLRLKTDIAPDHDVEQHYLQLKAEVNLGEQYSWLRRYANTLSNVQLELGVIRSDGKASTILRPHVQRVHGVMRLSPNAPSKLQLFSPFEFPLIQLSKPDMGAEAKQLGVLDLMMLTWFCHSPKGNQPCGVCVPCRDAVKMGMAHRLTLTSVLRRKLSDLRLAR